MGVALDRQVGQIAQGLTGALRVELSLAKEPAQDLGDLDVEKVRSVEGALRAEDAAGHRGSRRGLQEDLDGRRGVEDDHRPSRSAATAAATGSRGSTGCRLPLFLRPLEEGESGRPDDPRFRAWLARAQGQSPEEVRAEATRQGIAGMPLRDQMRLQLAFLDQGLHAIQ